MDYSPYYRQIDQLRAEIGKLQQDQRVLDLFSAEVSRGSQDFSKQLMHKRSSAQRIQSLANSNTAKGLSTMLLRAFGPSFQSGVEDSFGGVRREIARVFDEIDEEIRQKRAQVHTLENQLIQMQAEERQRQEMQRQEMQSMPTPQQ